jgi:hypothetical protein
MYFRRRRRDPHRPGTLKLLNPTNSVTGNLGASHGVIEVETIGDAGVASHAGAGT